MVVQKKAEIAYTKKTILQVVPSLVSGGVERGTLDVASALVKHDYRSIVCSGGGPLVQKLTDSGSIHVKLKVASKNPLMILRNSYTLKSLIKEYGVDLIHARSRAPAWSAYLASKDNELKKAGLRFLTTFHGIYKLSSYAKKLYNSVMTKGERVIAVSNFVKDHILNNYEIDEERIRVIHRGVDYTYFDPTKITSECILKFKEKYNVPSSMPIILLPARMTSWKGQMVLIEALNLLRDQNFYCMIVGDLSKHPHFVERLRNRIIALKLQSRAQIFGAEIDMLGLYGMADIVLSTSIEPEAFGRVVIEAQAMEKLTIATNIGGAAETIANEVTGFHCSPNDPADLADKIRYALSILGTSKANKITSSARASTIENFSLELMLTKTLDVYKELL